MSHTKGSWRMEKINKRSKYPLYRKYIIYSGICEVAEVALLPDVREGEMEANGRLIAAAPDLLEACKAAREWLGERPDENDSTKWGEHYEAKRVLIDQLDAAIKAVRQAKTHDRSNKRHYDVDPELGW